MSIRRLLLPAVALLLAGCGSSPHRAAAPAPAPDRTTSTPASSAGAPADPDCLRGVTAQLGAVARRVYREAESSDTVNTAVRLMQRSAPLSAAVAAGDRRATRRALQALEATGHLARVRVLAGGHPLADVGPREALAPHTIALDGASVTFSVQTPVGLVKTVQGLTSAHVVVRAGHQVIAGRPGGIPPSLPSTGVAVRGPLAALSFPATAFDGHRLTVSLLHSAAAGRALCGSSRTATATNVLAYLGQRIYTQETRGHAVSLQRARVSVDPALTRAVEAADPVATAAAVRALLNQHIVRLRVIAADGRVLADVGGPHVLGPETGSLPGGARFVFSVQDDLGYLLLAHRLLGAEVLIRGAGGQILSTMGAGPASVPDRGTVQFGGRSYAAWSLHAAAFPAGSLRISLLMALS